MGIRSLPLRIEDIGASISSTNLTVLDGEIVCADKE